jgi:carboxylesterase type B
MNFKDFKLKFKKIFFNIDVDMYLKNVISENTVDKNHPSFYQYQLKQAFELGIFCGPITSQIKYMSILNNAYMYNFDFKSKSNPYPIHTAELKYIFGNYIQNNSIDKKIANVISDY